MNAHFILQLLSNRGGKALLAAPRLLGAIIVIAGLSACLAAPPSTSSDGSPSPTPPDGFQFPAPIQPLPPAAQAQPAPDTAQASVGFNVSGWV